MKADVVSDLSEFLIFGHEIQHCLRYKTDLTAYFRKDGKGKEAGPT